MSADRKRTLDSGVPRLDVVLGGGIPVGDLLLVVGAPGSGKTTLACQVMFHRASMGDKVLFVSTLSEPSSRLVKHLRTLSFFDESALSRTVFLESIFPVARSGIEPLLAALSESVRAHGASVVILDGLASLRDLHPEAMELRSLVNRLSVSMTAHGCTTLVTSSDVPNMRSASSAPEFTMCDSIVELWQSQPGEPLRRSLRAWKVRGAEPLLGAQTFRIGASGLTVFPRFGRHMVPADEPVAPVPRRSWGDHELDALMSGGLPSGSSTLLAGASGTGKTLLALQFLLDGAARGEAGLFVSLRASEGQLKLKARSFELDLEGAIATRRAVVLRRLPTDLGLDELLHEIWDALEQSSATRLVLDSAAELEQALAHELGASALVAFVELLRVRGITTVVVRPVAQRIGRELDFIHSPFEVFAENVLLLRHIERDDSLERGLSVLKMRDAAYDPDTRPYRLASGGLQVLPAPARGAGGTSPTQPPERPPYKPTDPRDE